jgi:hypothetical protein
VEGRFQFPKVPEIDAMVDVAVEVELENEIIARRRDPEPILPTEDIVDVCTRRVTQRSSQPPGVVEAVNRAAVGNAYRLFYDCEPPGSAQTAARVLIMAEVQRFDDRAATRYTLTLQVEGIHIPAGVVYR